MPAHETSFKIGDFAFTKGVRKGPVTFKKVIIAAIPDADDATVDYVLWDRTPYPFAKLTARDLFKSADRFRRACVSGKRLCDMCDQVVAPDKWTCKQCSDTLEIDTVRDMKGS